MAFSSNGLTPVYLGGSGGVKDWVYVTTDSIPTVMASGYFNDAANLMEIGERIDIRVVDAVDPNTRTSLTAQQYAYVATNNGSTVTTSVAVEGGAVIVTTATTLSVTQASHHGKTVRIDSAAPIAVSLPAATGSGAKFRFLIGVAATGTSHTIAANGTDVMQGYAFAVTTTSDNAEGFKTSATSDKVSLNGTTLGGVVGDIVEVEDIKAATWSVLVFSAPTGTEATPFSAS